MAIELLTDKRIKGLRADEGRFEIRDAKVTGLVLRVTASGAKTWSVQYRVKGKPGTQRETLGPYPRVSIADARGRADAILKRVSAGGDPKADAKARRARMTVRELAERYLELHAKPSKRSWRGDEQMLNLSVLPVIGDMAIADVHRRDITRVLDKVLERGAAIQANRTWEVVRAMFRWAVRRGDLDHSPHEGLGRPSKENRRDRTLSRKAFEDHTGETRPAEVAVLWEKLPACPMSEGMRDVIRLQLLTGQRSGEVAGMRLDELDLRAREWLLPPERTKNKRSHEVPLSAWALEIIRGAIARGHGLPFVFPSPTGDQAVESMAVAKAVKRSLHALGLDPFTPHDLRRTVATALIEQGELPVVVEAALNHISGAQGTVTAAHYVRHPYAEEKRAALERWADRLRAIVEGRDVVVSLHPNSIGARSQAGENSAEPA